MRKFLLYMVVTIALLIVTGTAAAAEQDACIACHSSTTPSIVEDWKKSKHSEIGVSCYTCHQVAEGDYAEEHHGYQITPVVSPKKCANCHEYEYTTQMKSKHAFSAINGPLKPWYIEMKKRGLDPLDSNVARENPPEEYIKDMVTALFPASGVAEKAGLFDAGFNHANQFLGCMECHGSYVYYDGEKLRGWPNLGVGRVNPDGSIGACSSCHSAHQFSIKEARKPETCGKCHLGYDHPQIEIYESSYHGVRYEADEENWNWEAQPWKAGVDFSAPTCAACHMSEIASPSGKVIVEGTHDVGARLKWEIQAKFVMYQSSNSNLAAGGFKPDKELAEENRERMRKVCLQCHSPYWVDEYFNHYEKVLEDYNITANYAYNLLQQIYAEGLADKSNPLDEYPEMMWYYIWHHEGRRWRMGASMMGPDFTHWAGAVDTIMDKLGRMLDWYETQKKLRGTEGLKASAMLEQSNYVPTNEDSIKASSTEQGSIPLTNLGMGVLAAVFGLTSIALVWRSRK